MSVQLIEENKGLGILNQEGLETRKLLEITGMESRSGWSRENTVK